MSVYFLEMVRVLLLLKQEMIYCLFQRMHLDKRKPLYMKRPRGNCPFIEEKEDDVYLHMDGQEIYRFCC